MRKQMQSIPIKGMTQDVAISKFSPEFSFRNYNLSISGDSSNTTYVLTNSKGNVDIELFDENGSVTTLQGSVIGQCVLNEYLVLFTTTRVEPEYAGADNIYRLELLTPQGSLSPRAKVVKLYSSVGKDSLGFSKKHLIETVPVYESESIQKVYWVDGINQPRFINIVSPDIGGLSKNSFEFCPELKLEEGYTVFKDFTGGQFHSGTIQYAFSYWNKNGTETNLFLTTRLYTLSNQEKGGSPDDTVTCSFRIELTKLDPNYDYLRVYAIQRSSLDGVTSARIVKDIDMKTVSYSRYSLFDDGIIGRAYPAASLFYIGGEELVIGTIATKDNTLFGGNVRIKRPSISDITLDNTKVNFQWKTMLTDIQRYTASSMGYEDVYIYEPYTLEDNIFGPTTTNKSLFIRHWKKGETYRIGIQAQYKTGIWSEVLYLGDFEVDKGYGTSVEMGNVMASSTTITYVVGEMEINPPLINDLKSRGFKRIRPVYVPLTSKDRRIVGQGILTNTISNAVARGNNSPFAYPDYYTRGNNDLVPFRTPGTVGNRFTNTNRNGHLAFPAWQHFSPLRLSKSYITNATNNFEYIEIRGSQRFDEGNLADIFLDSLVRDNTGSKQYWENFYIGWFIDTNLVNFWSPEVEFGDIRNNLDNADSVIFRGSANITASTTTFDTYSSKGARDGQALSIHNFSYGASRVLSQFGFSAEVTAGGWKETDNHVETGYLWDAEKMEGKDITYKKKKISRMVFCGFNDMFVDMDPLHGTPLAPKSSVIYLPKYVDKTDVAVGYKTNYTDGASGNISYMTKVDEVVGHFDGAEPTSKMSATEISYTTNSHLLFSFEASQTLPLYDASSNAAAAASMRRTYGKPYYRTSQNATGFTVPIINNATYLNKSNSFMTDRPYNSKKYLPEMQLSGYPYLWIVDLVRPISASTKYGGNDLGAINSNVWIPCGDSYSLDSVDLTNVLLTEGDTYIQRYDFMKTGKGTSTYQEFTEVVSVILESYINLDGRWDSKRGNTVVKDYVMDNYTHINYAYSQKNNFFTGAVLNPSLLASDSLPTSFVWSENKLYSEYIDSWTNLWLNNSYTVEGNMGPINYLTQYNNELLGFQDKGIFQILYNSRVQIATSDGVPVEIAQSGKTEGVRYLTSNSGTTNKWSVASGSKSLFYIDTFNKSFNAVSSPPSSVSDALGFKSWALENFTNSGEYNIYDNDTAFSVNTDTITGSIYLNSKNTSLKYNEKFNMFESFMSYENVPFMLNIWGSSLSILNGTNSATLWINDIGKYNDFFGTSKKSEIDFMIAPEPHLDKVFDTFQYRADWFDGNNYLPKVTFNTVTTSNEYQTSTKNLMATSPTYNSKKFRAWSFPFPRQAGTMNRMRNPWVKLSFSMDNPNGYKMLLHDLIINYTV